MTSRRELLARLQTERFHLLVIGGGIVGAGIARDAAMRGLRVALIEQGDFASGTSSKTSKLIHGGLRYLEHGQVRLVRESLRERHTLHLIAPSLVRPLSLALPVYRNARRPLWQVSLGLALYDLIAGRRNIQSHRMLSAARMASLEPHMTPEGLVGGGLYTDCQMDDARLCLANILQAVDLGGVCCNYVRLKQLLTMEGRVCGGIAEEVGTGRAYEIHAEAVVNATGPWADHIRRMSRRRAPPRVAPTKGIHLILPRLTRQAFFFEARADRRMLFLLPWGDYSLVGTTESVVPEDQDVGALQANADEVAYLLEEIQRLFPMSHLSEEDVIATYAGARPLLAFEGSANRASRDARLDVDGTGLVSVFGGKYTTYRVIAQQVVDFLTRHHRWSVERCLTDQVELIEPVHAIALDHWAPLLETLDGSLVTRLSACYGTGFFSILRLIDHDPTLARPVCPHHPYLGAELVHAIQEEFACTMTDVLARRTRIAWSSCQGLDFLSTLGEWMQRYGHGTPTAVTSQVEAYQQFLSMGLAFRPSLLLSRSWVGAVESTER